MQRRPAGPPTGTVTFFFSDIEGSTRLVQRWGPDWPELLERHRRALRTEFAEHRGWEQGTEGDSFFVVFERAGDAVAAAAAAQRALARLEWPADGEIRVRVGLHSGEGRLSGGDYVGLDVHRAARIGAAGHGGQVLVSEATTALAQGSLPVGCRLVDLGLHRLKDLPQPERLHQLTIEGLRSEFPPLRTLGARPSNLPVALSSLIGREADVDAVSAFLAESRLVTVVGPGGTGKTRLVQEVARRLAPTFDGGATFVPLAALRDPDLIAVEILRALRLDTAASAPPRDRLVEALSGQAALLVLDNLEQLIGVGPVVADLLGAITNLRILASSQAGLHATGEREYPLAPLPDSAAIELFIERAKAVVPGFTLDPESHAAVAAICERLDGLPLAIELAAAQVRLLSPTAILARLGDRIEALSSRREDLPERQRTLRAAVMWSYDLLPAPEQALFRRLSVFVGGATIADLEVFEACRGLAEDALTTLDGLVDRSLVVVRRPPGEEHRFAMLETIRSVAGELLRGADEEAAALNDHATVFRHLAAEAEPEMYGSSRRRWLDRLAAEHDNLRAAIDHLTATGEIAAAIDLAADIWRFWQTRGHLIEARRRINALLAKANDIGGMPPLTMSRGEEAAGGIAYWMRTESGPDVEPHYTRAVAYARESGDRDREAWALYNLAFVYDFTGLGPSDPERGRKLRGEALELFRAVGDRRGIGESLWALGGSTVVMRQDPGGARELLAEASTILEEIGDSYGASWAFTSLGILELQATQHDAARAALLAGAEIFLRDEDVSGQIISIQALGALAEVRGDDRTAVRLGAAANELARRIGADPPVISMLANPIANAMARLSKEEIAAEEEAARSIEARPFLEAAIAEASAAAAGDQ